MHRDHPVNDWATAVGQTGQLIDVREPDEVAGGTLPGAVNIPLGTIPERRAEIDRDRPVVLLCKSGGRSTQAAQFLVASGYGDVTNLEGGWLAYSG